MLRCPCGRIYEVDESLAGRRLRCGCGRILTIGTTIVYEPPPRGRDPDPVGRVTDQSTSGSREGDGVPTGWVVAFVIAAILLMALLAPNDPAAPRSGSRTVRPPAAATGADRIRNPVDVALGSRAAVPVACDPAEVIRPRSSQELSRYYATGNGRLTIANGTDMDAVAVLVRTYDRKPYRAMYIRAGENGVFTRVARGRYYLRFQFGIDWLRERRFCEIRGISQFTETLDFEEFFDGEAVNYTTFEVTLHPVVGGNARTERISAAEFQLPPL